MNDFKVGDRVRLEGIVTSDNVYNNGIGVRMNGDTHSTFNAITAKAMAHATLIEPDVKAAEEKPLDLSKPVRIKVRPDVEVREVFGPSSRGFYLVDRADRILDIRLAEELENIPEPKITTSDVLSLWEFKTGARAFLWGDAAGCATRLSQVRVSYTEGEGWSIEEVK